MGSVLAGEATSAQIAAFAAGLRIKGETVTEMTGLVRAMLDKATPIDLEQPLVDVVGGDVERNLAIAKAVLAGQGGPARDIVLLNAAAALVAADAALGLPDGIEVAARSIDEGRAAAKLDAWVEVSRRVTPA